MFLNPWDPKTADWGMVSHLVYLATAGPSYGKRAGRTVIHCRTTENGRDAPFYTAELQQTGETRRSTRHGHPCRSLLGQVLNIVEILVPPRCQFIATQVSKRNVRGIAMAPDRITADEEIAN